MSDEYIVIMSNGDKYHIKYPGMYDLSFIDMSKNISGLVLVNDVLFGSIYLNTQQICSIERVKK